MRWFSVSSAGSYWAFLRDHRHWLYNLPALGLFTYSDVIGFGPLGSTLLLQRLYVLGLALLLLAVAIAAYPRVIRSWRRGAPVPGESRAAPHPAAGGDGCRLPPPRW